MSKVSVIDSNAKELEQIALPEDFNQINGHNFYLQIKSYLSETRANTAKTKTRAEVRGGGKKPWSQKGRGTARSGSRRSPIWVGGGKAFGPTKRNYFQKINKKQRKLAFHYAIAEKASNSQLFAMDKIEVVSGKTTDAKAFLNNFPNAKDILIVANFENIDEKTFLAFRNISNAYMIDPKELNVYMLSAYSNVIFQKDVFENIMKENQDG